MTISLPANPDISLLKKHAKKLLKEYRLNNPEALASIQSLHPKPSDFNGLRDAQLVIARLYGYNGWAELSEAVAIKHYAATSSAEKAELFIQLGCVRYNGHDSLRNYQRAQTLLTLYPKIAEFSFYTALVANHTPTVLHHLKSNPELANEVGGPFKWPTLLYATYSRINCPSKSQDSLTIVEALLANGADANAHIILNDTYRFTALTGAMGEGEGGINQPPHRYADELATLLLDAGAKPNDAQGLYNTMFTSSGDKWLTLLISKGLNAEDKLNWYDPNNNSTQTTFDYQLASAVSGGHKERVKILLAAGANASTINGYDERTVHTNALLKGHGTIANLLIEAGAKAQTLVIEDEFRIACVNKNDQLIVQLLQQSPQLKNDPSLLHDAVTHGDPSIFKLLINHGFDINGQANYGRTILHHFALTNDIDAVNYCLDNGARIDIQDDSHKNTPVGFAAYVGAYDVMYLLLDHSDQLLDVVCCGYFERAQTLLQEDPSRIKDCTSMGNTALHIIGAWLNEEPDYFLCKDFMELLVSAGANIHTKNKNGQTPLEFSLANGVETIADLLGEYST